MAEEFDIDAYLAQQPAAKKPARPEPPAEPPAAFDVDAYLAQQAQPKVGMVETFANQGANTLPLGRMLVNLLSTGAVQGAKLLGAGSPNVRLTPEALAEAKARGLPVNEESAIPGVLDTYRRVRDTRDIRTDAGNAQNPWTSRAATGTALLASLGIPMPQALGGAGLGRQAVQALRGGTQSLKQLAGAGAAMGALQAAGDSRADLTSGGLGDVGQQVVDTALGGALGTVGAPIGFAAGKLAPAAVRGVQGLLNQGGLNLGRRALLSGADTLSSRLPLSEDAVREALRSGAILPLGTTRGAFNRLSRMSDDMGRVYGDIVEGLEARGVQGPEAVSLAEELVRRADELAPNTMNEALPQRFRDMSQTLLRKVDTEPGNLGLTQSENLKRSLQEMARYGRLEETPLNEVNREIASVVREANEKAIEEAAQRSVDPEIIERAESFVPVKRRMGRLLEAEAAAQRGTARESTRNPFSIYDLLIGGMASGGDMGTGAALALGAKLLRPRLASTGASSLYWAGEGLGGLANMAMRGAASGTLPAGGARAASALERQQLGDWLAGQDVTPDAMAAALRRRR